ncbi:MAG: hypothetical protein OEN01_06780 [Candidatus Krumholzibacteria bacterium]|nr:hypothetical protein [Candidatus Krumholzibacteria bacterium]
MRYEKHAVTIFAATVFAVCSHDAAARGRLILHERFPTRGQEMRIRVEDEAQNPVGGAIVDVTYRPGSKVERVDHVGTSSSDGMITWTPTQAGIATITATWSEHDQMLRSSQASVSVKFPSPPADGILIMIVAGVLLVGGSSIRLFYMLRTQQAP